MAAIEILMMKMSNSLLVHNSNVVEVNHAQIHAQPFKHIAYTVEPRVLSRLCGERTLYYLLT